MKKRNKAALALGALALLAAAGAATTYAANNDTARPIMKDATRQAIEKAFATNDYAAFQKAIEGKQKPADAPEITESIFAQMVKAHALREAGDMEGADKIMESLGFPKHPHGNHDGKGMIPPNLTDEQKSAFEKAHALMEAGDRDGAKQILDEAGIKMPEPPVRQALTDEQKNTLDAARTLFESGKEDEARALLESAGIQAPPRK